MDSTNNKYQKTNTKKSSSIKKEKGNISIQTIKYLVMNPLAVNYKLHQTSYSTQE